MIRLNTLNGMLSICVIIASLFVGCSADDNANEMETVSNIDESTGYENEESEDYTQLHIAMFTLSDSPDALLVQDAVNEILRERINAEVRIDFIGIGSYTQKTNLMLSLNEPLDLMPTLVNPSLASYVSNGQFLPLDDLLDEYGQGILENIPDNYIDYGRIDGRIYGITTNRDLAKSYGFTFRKDLAEKHGIQASDIKTLNDIETALKIIKENESDMYPLAPQQRSYITSRWGTFDDLGDGNWLGVLMYEGTALEIVNYYESDEFRNFIYETKSWYDDGLIMPYILMNTEPGSSLVKTGKAFGYLSNTKPGFDVQETRATGMDMITADLIPAYASTSDVQGIVWAIPHNCTQPDKAMQLMNELYSNEEISNLLIYGIEGKHYEVKDAENGIIGYPTGVDASTTGYPGGTGWGWPNQFLGYVWEGNPADYWERMDTFNRTAKHSLALGFTFDASGVTTEMLACDNVIKEYRNALMSGALDPEAALPIFIDELKEAGIDAIITEKQKQLDDWSSLQP